MKKDFNRLKQLIAIIPTIICILCLTLAINTNGKTFMILISIGLLSLLTIFIIGFAFNKPKRKQSLNPKGNVLLNKEIIKNRIKDIPSEKELFILFTDYNIDINKEILNYYMKGLQKSSLETNFLEREEIDITKEEELFIRNNYECLNAWPYVNFLMEDKITLENKYINNILIPIDTIMYIGLRKPITKEYAFKWKTILNQEIKNTSLLIDNIANEYEITTKESCMFLAKSTNYKIPQWIFELVYETNKKPH